MRENTRNVMISR